MSDESVSRRSALKTLGALGVAPLVGHADRPDVPACEAGRSDRQQAAEPGRRTVAEHPRLHRLRAGRMLVAGRLALRMTDSTGLVETARPTIQGLDAGTYVTYGGASGTRDVSRALELEVPMGRAESVEIGRRGT